MMPWQHSRRPEEQEQQNNEALIRTETEGVPNAYISSGNRTTDPEYPGDDASGTVMTKYKRTVGEYTKHLLDAFEDCARLGLIGEELWKDAKDSWNVYGIQHMRSCNLTIAIDIDRRRCTHHNEL